MNLKEIENSEIRKLREYLETLSDTIRTGNVYWEFDVRLIEYNVTCPSIQEVIKLAYPGVRPDLAQISEGSVDDLRLTLESELGRYPPHLISKYIAGIWPLLEDCIDYQNSRIFDYFTSERNDLLNGIAGSFAVIIFNVQLNHFLFLIGGTDA